MFLNEDDMASRNTCWPLLQNCLTDGGADVKEITSIRRETCSIDKMEHRPNCKGGTVTSPTFRRRRRRESVTLGQARAASIRRESHKS